MNIKGEMFSILRIIFLIIFYTPLVNISKLKEVVNKIFRKDASFIKYILIGFTGLSLDMLSFMFMVYILNINHLIANPIGMCIGIINNFFLNAYFNFKKTDKILIRLIKFFSIGVFGIFVSELIIYLIHDLFFAKLLFETVNPLLNGRFLSIEVTLTKGFSIIVIAVIQYFLHKRITFKGES